MTADITDGKTEFRTSDLYDWIASLDLTVSYKKSVLKKLKRLLPDCIYSAAYIPILLKTSPILQQDRYLVYGVRILLRYLREKELLPEDEILKAARRLKGIKSHPDQYVPTDDEVKAQLTKLNPARRTVFLMYLASGLRKNEGEYLLQNLSILKPQFKGDYVKIELGLYRKTKNANFAYLPAWLYQDLLSVSKEGSVTVCGLDLHIKRNKGVLIKYCRKWFYTKCIEIGIPESIADYFEGRVSMSVGGRHYLARQVLADKWYGTFAEAINLLKSIQGFKES